MGLRQDMGVRKHFLYERQPESALRGGNETREALGGLCPGIAFADESANPKKGQRKPFAKMERSRLYFLLVQGARGVTAEGRELGHAFKPSDDCCHSSPVTFWSPHSSNE